MERLNLIFLAYIIHPYLQLHKHTNQQFIDKFPELFVDLSNRYSNMMTAGDFNIQHFHVEIKM